MLNKIYLLPLGLVILAMLTAVAVWAYSGWYFTKQRPMPRLWRWGNACLLIAVLPAILYTTLAREPSAARELILIPFRSFADAKQLPELYRSMLMNVLLFLPLGLALSNALPERWHLTTRILLTALTGLLLSILIECMQYVFVLGRTEVDDLLCNTFGTILGTLSLVCRRWAKKLWTYLGDYSFIHRYE